MTRCVLFDFDGTLIDTWRLYLESFRRALEPHFNRLLSDGEILDLHPTAERRLLRRVVEDIRLADYFESFLSHYRAVHDAFLDGLYPGVPAMLADLQADGYVLGVVTGKSRAAWNTTFSKSGLQAFDVVVTDDDVMHPKPDPEGLMTALKAVNVRPSEAFYIGDSLLDCEAACAARISFGAALWSKQTFEQDAFVAAVERLGIREVFKDPSAVVQKFASCPRMRCDA
jgi:HAD superfamily hydrolase (TIGR01509 family)